MRRISIVVIPTDPEEEIRDTHVRSTNLGDYQDIVGGQVNAIELHGPAALLWTNASESDRFPPNIRATNLAHRHQAALHVFDSIRGDAFITGPLDERHVEEDIPESYRQELTYE